VSVFLEVPVTSWVASNDLAFAIRDRYAVTEGHTLIITKRVVADWFSATAEERAAMLALVDEVKRDLDDRYAPHGYNVGFNAGAAAGQTVMHLHVHVIPRRHGDVPDPRGGIRHVIPSKANYLRSQPLTIGGDDPFSRQVLPLFDRATEIRIVVAFVQLSGLERIRPALSAALERGAAIRIVTGDYLNITQAQALSELLDLERASTDGEIRGHLQARVVKALDQKVASFHPKSWAFESDAFGAAFVGSSNLSRNALERGIEWNLRVDREVDRIGFERVSKAFEELWQFACVLDADWIADYSLRARRDSIPLPPGEEDEEALDKPPEPHEVQLEALAALRATREANRNRPR